MNLAKKILYLFSFLTLVMTFITICVFAYWMFWPDNVMVLKSDIVKTDKEVYRPGERISYTVDYCKKRQISGLTSRTLVNDIRIAYTTITSDLPAGCHIVSDNDLIIPEFTSEGKYHISILVEYKINPIRVLRINYRTNEFIVKN